MKRINLIVLLFLAITATISAQQVANSGFETFQSDDLNGTGVRPTSWNASNVKRTVFGITATGDLVFEDNNGRTGKCVRIESKEVGAAGITEAAPGWVTLGRPWNYLSGADVSSATAGTDGGIMFKYRPDTLALWIKRTYSAQEDANIVIYSWKGTSQGNGYRTKGGGCAGGEHTDEESDIRQQFDKNDCGTVALATQIAEGHWRDNKQYTEWTEIKVPITYLTNDVPEKMNIILSSNNYPNKRSTNVKSGAALYADDLRLIYSSAAHEILLNNRSMSGFTPSQTEYTYALGASATDIPTITLKRSGRVLDTKEYSITKGAIGGVTKITVHAEDGSSSTTYSITFVGEVSKNPRPANITIGGTSVPNYNPLVFKYDIELPYGTTVCPDIDILPAEMGQTFTVSKPASLPGTATVTVTAPDGATSQTYTLNLTVGPLTDNTLTDIRVNGKTITGFKPSTTNYVVELPMGTTADPQIEYTTAYPAEHEVVIDNKGIEGGATISVTPKGTTNTRTYRLRFVVTASTYSYLQSISVGGEELPDYDPATLSYTINLPLGTAELPAITWVQGDDYQTVTIDRGTLNGVTKITVTAQSGAVSIYRLTFSTAQSSVSSLKAIMIDGTPIADFDPATLSYTIALPVGTAEMPVITWTKGDDYQTVSLVDGGLGGTSRLVVKAQDGSVTTYSIKFTVAQASNSTLLDIKLDGTTIDGFSPDITSYTVSLPRGTVSLPSITYTTADEYQEVRVIEGGINGDTRIIVKAQSGASTTYIITFKVEVNSNVSLADIQVGGVSLEGFAPDITEYTYQLPSGTTALPEITYTTADAAQRVVLTYGGVNGTTTLLVIAEDNTRRTYSITFSVAKSESAMLEMIYVGGEPLASFLPTTLEYSYEIPSTATRCPAITVDKAAGQSVSIITPKLTGTVRIEVTPEAGAKNVYTIDIHYPMSSNSYLDVITVGGNAIPGFRPDSLEYHLTLPEGTTKLPDIGYTRAESSQKVYKVMGGVNSLTTVSVRAEDGSETIYKLYFTVSRSNISLLDNILVGGVALEGFAPDKYDYTYTIAPTDLKTPAITYERADDGQRVELTAPAAEGTASIKVVAEDLNDTTTYTIAFAYEVSSDATLSEITLDGTLLPMDMFVNDTAWIDLTAIRSASKAKSRRYMATANPLPEIKCTAANPRQYIAIAESGVNGWEALVVAEDGTEHRYVIRYRIPESNVSTLAGLELYSENRWIPIEDFDAATLSYTATLPWRTRTAPIINPIAGDKGQTIRIDYGRVNTPTTVTVTAEDGVTSTVYTIEYTVEKSSVATLDAIYADGQMLPDFDAEKTEYTIQVKAGASMPSITWDNAIVQGSPVTEQRVIYKAMGLDSVSTLTVVAEDGTSKVYSLKYELQADDSKVNGLNNLLVGGIPLTDFTSEKKNYKFTLPYGTEEVPAVECIKKFAEQQVIVSYTGGVAGEIAVKVLAEGLDPVVYTIDLSVSKTPKTSLASVTVDGGTVVDGFRPEQTTHIVIAAGNERPVINAEPANGCQKEEKLSTDNIYQVEVYDLNSTDALMYTFYIHYKSDTIPNATFDQWTTAIKDANGQKPESWTVPADIDAGGRYATVNYYTAPAVSVADNGAVRLKTIFGWNSIAGAVPGMMTLGDMQLSLKTFSKSSSSVSGGIPFRNSPEVLELEYNPISNSNIGNWRAVINVSDGSTSAVTEYIGSFDNKNSWQEAVIPIKYNSSDRFVRQINITLNSAYSENAGDLGGTALNEKSSELLVDNLRFTYSNKLSAIVVDGDTVDSFDPDKISCQYSLPADYQGIPDVVVVGEVPDQAHRINVNNKETNGRRPVSITSVAEDGSKKIYMLSLVRDGKSTNASLGSILVGGVPVENFSADVLNYTVDVADMKRLPDVAVIAGSCHQTVSVEHSATAVEITVTAEDGTTIRQYEVEFQEVLSDDATLAEVKVAGHDDFAFAADSLSYDIQLAYDEALPQVTFVKTDAGQKVVMATGDTTTLEVISEDRTDTTRYTIAFIRQPEPATATLTALAVNNMSVDGFSADKFDYEYDNTAAEQLAWTFVRGAVTDSVSQTITADSLLLTVTGGESNTYRVAVYSAANASADLTAVCLDGDTLTEFAPSLLEYERDVVRGQRHQLYASVADGAHLTVDYISGEDNVAAFAFKASANNGLEPKTTTVMFNTIKSVGVNLENILLDSEPLLVSGTDFTSSADFSSDVSEYEITLSAESPKMSQPAVPVISVLGGAYGQDITVEQGSLDKPAVVNVTSEAGGNRTYSLYFSAQKSSVSTLADLAIDYTTVPGFDPDSLRYSYEIKAGEKLPVVTYRTADAFQTVDVMTVADSTVVTVEAEDGVVARYVINYSVVRSSEVSLSGINKDGMPLDGFSPDTYDYYVTLPVGTVTLPQITAIAGQDGQSISVTEGGVNGTTTIHVVAEDGVTTADYRIHFNRLLSTNSHLDMIYVDGSPLTLFTDKYTASAAFDTAVHAYTITLPVGIKTAPVITWKQGDEWQTVSSSTDEKGNITIHVVPEQTELAADYTVELVYTLSKNAQLQSIIVDGNTLEEFNAAILNYVYTLPVDATVAPEVIALKGDEWQTVNYTPADSVNGTAVIEVIAEDTVVKNIYTVRFNRTLSDNVTLSSIMVGGVVIENFAPDRHTYSVVLPIGSTSLPRVTWELGDKYQSVDTISTGVNGSYIITVKAENGMTNNYIISFSVERSHNAYLKSISYNGEVLNGFDAEIFAYDITLPYGTVSAPAVAYELAEPGLQSVLYTPAISIADTIRIEVTADDDSTACTYTIAFSVARSDNARLAEIKIGGEPISAAAHGFATDRDFSADEYNYNITLPYGTTELPEITWRGEVDDYTSITITGDTAVTTKTVITVVSDDEMAVNEYVLNFSVRKSDNALLAALQVGDNLIKDFESNNLDYTVAFPIGTDTASLPTVADVVYTKQMESQTVTVDQTTPEEIIVTVVAEDGAAVNVYVIRFTIELSNNALLSNILVDGVALESFSPTQFEYVYLLMPGAALPTLEGVKAEDGQQIFVTMGVIGEASYIYVVAEDATESEYRVYFKTSEINPGERPSMDDVAWTPLGDGNFKASTIRDNVQVMVYLPSGLRVRTENVDLVDPNDNIKDDHDGGTILHFDRRGQTYIYVFVYNNHVVKSGKFSY